MKITTVLLCAFAALILTAAPTDGKLSNNIVSQWVNETQAMVARVGIQNQLSAKYYGLVGLTILDAIRAGGAPAPALAAFAGHAVLSAWFPWSQSKYDGIIARQLADVSEADKKAAQDVAVPIAAKHLRERTVVASTRWAQFKPAAPGTLWAYQFAPEQKDSLYPQLAQATPFFLTSQESEAIAFNSDPAKGPVFKPPRNDYAETFKYGAKDSKDRSQYDTDSAFFWADGANTSAITGHWLDIAREVLPDLSVEDTALFFARAGAAAYDASITAWKVKYSTLAWRPIHAFRLGYPGFNGVSSWTPLLPTPPHPEYPSGHQASVGALLEVILRTLGGKDDVTFRIGSEGTPWLTRSYNSLTKAAVEVGDSRLFAGLHFPSANVDGLKLGRLTGGKVFDRIQAAGRRRSSKAAGTITTEAGRTKKAVAGRRMRA